MVPLILAGADSKHLTEKEFAKRVKFLKNRHNIDLLSTGGLFFIFYEFLIVFLFSQY